MSFCVCVWGCPVLCVYMVCCFCGLVDNSFTHTAYTHDNNNNFVTSLCQKVGYFDGFLYLFRFYTILVCVFILHLLILDEPRRGFVHKLNTICFCLACFLLTRRFFTSDRPKCTKMHLNV